MVRCRSEGNGSTPRGIASEALLFRLIPYRSDSISVTDDERVRRWTLRDIEQFVALFVFKCCPSYFRSDRVPIPWAERVGAGDDDEKGRRMDDEEESAIDAFDAIVSGTDRAFPEQLDMFNALMLVWSIYRGHCHHIRHSDGVQWKRDTLTRFVTAICSQFFEEFE